MFYLSDASIDPNFLKRQMENPRAGAFVSFEGWVRDHNAGKRVRGLEYEAFPALADKVMSQIIQEAKMEYDVLDIHCVHRTGKLLIGEIAVWIGVLSVHRKAAFLACEFIIDELKNRVPIWKKETYQDGHSQWVQCDACMNHHRKGSYA